jgi:hypothetical protein
MSDHAWPWLVRMLPIATLATLVGAFHVWLGFWLTGVATGLVLLAYVWHMRPFYGPVLAVLEEKLGPASGRENWESIVEFMAGTKPGDCPPDQRDAPGSEKSIALVYQGVDAVRKIREVLGPTDPAKAPPGSIRKEFGRTIMINAAHASDSVENARREMEIVRVDENNFKPLIENFYGRQ